MLQIGQLGGRELPEHLLSHRMCPLGSSFSMLLLQGQLVLPQPLDDLRLMHSHDGTAQACVAKGLRVL